MVKVAFAGAFAAQLVEPVRSRLSVPCEIIAGEEPEILTGLADTDVVVGLAFSHRMADAAPHLRLVQVPGAGLDRIDRSALRAGTYLANVYGHEAGIAEYIFGAMLTMTRSFSRLDSKLRHGEWDSQWALGVPPPALWPELAGKTLGILGYGHIGQALARRARAFEMAVCALRRQAEEPAPDGLEFLGDVTRLDEILERADYLAITLSLSDATRNLIGERQLDRMKPTAFLINVARAELIDEGALYRALADKRIAGAALDVWYRYPTAPGPAEPANLPFHGLDNVLMTPHVSGWTEGTMNARSQLIAENIARTARGEPPLNLVAPAA